MIRVQMALLLAIGAATCSGCAAWREQLQSPSIEEQRQQRRAEAVHSFEQHRDEAQLQAALDRWSQGDAAGCEARLRGLLARQPQSTEIRLRLAELLWSKGDAAQAEAELNQILAAAPGHAESHHVLGMLLAEQNRLNESRTHLARAVELDPSSDIFRETRDSVPAEVAVASASR